MTKSGKTLIVAELAREYGFKDVGGLLSSAVELHSEFDTYILFVSLYRLESLFLIPYM